ncbi:hypothetical protein FNF29_05288 [Cafeteria roenbergensis]|uniref:C2 domain-containing protein n=1 Tax=Cafeteria roenbergensis TaxID=33653 RepID=A0A5A8CC37_CAFRO|nr:hypothetical protein FNF29_05288 [Cafeteria roenbergensis]|eukprot:KAA0150485.1 hypothetical protein FNF29_05288 [Cafeteria roenbergensis]
MPRRLANRVLMLLVVLLAALCAVQPAAAQAFVFAAWVPTEWGQCSRPCGGGVQYRSVDCRDSILLLTNASNCPGEPPISSRPCNQQLCRAPEYVTMSCDAARGSERCSSYFRVGGRVTVRVVSARYLPQMDSFGTISGESDPYAVVTLGAIKRVSSVVRNSNNPVWPGGGDAMDFGVRDSGTPFTVQLFDADTGLEFDDDVIGSVGAAVIACSQFSGTECSERAFYPLQADRPCYVSGNVSRLSVGAPCVEIDVRVTPFTVTVEDTAVDMPRIVDVANSFGSEQSGLIYSQSSVLQVDANYPEFASARGGMIVRTRNQDRLEFLPAEYLTFSINFRAVVFVFRRQLDFEATEPAWLQPATGWQLTTRPAVRMAVGTPGGLVSTETTSLYRAYNKSFAPGSVITVDGARQGVDPAVEPPAMYAVVVRHVPDSDELPPVPSKEFDRVKFLELLIEFQLPNVILALILVSFLRQINYDPSLIEAWFASRILPDPPHPEARDVNRQLGTFSAEDRSRMSLTASLFLAHGATSRNLQFRRNMFWAGTLARALLGAPLVVTLAHGIVTAAVVRPPQVGWGVILVGEAMWLGAFAVGRWRHAAWRMDAATLSLFGTSLALVLAYLVVVVFVDPLDVSAFSLTAVLLTLNMLPLVWLAFHADPGLRTSLDSIATTSRRNRRIGKARRRLATMGKMGLLQRLRAGVATPGGGGGGGGGGGTPGAGADTPGSAGGGFGGAPDAGPGSSARVTEDDRGGFPSSAGGFGGVGGSEGGAFLEAQEAWASLKEAPGFEGMSDARLRAVAKQMRDLVNSKPWLGIDDHASAAAALAADGADEDGPAGGRTGDEDGSADGSARHGGAGSALASLLGTAYTINAASAGGVFALSDPLSGLLASSGSSNAPGAAAGSKADARSVARAHEAAERRNRARTLKLLYVASLLCLFVLSVVSWAHVRGAPNAGIAASLTVLAGDSVVFFALRSGKVEWSPGAICALMAVSRGLVALFAGRLWLVGTSLCFAMWGGALAVQIVGRALPRLSAAAAGAIAYLDADKPRIGISFSRAAGRPGSRAAAARSGGRAGAGASKAGSIRPGSRLGGAGRAGADLKETAEQEARRLDMSGSPEFVLAYLSILFVMTLLAAVFTGADPAAAAAGGTASVSLAVSDALASAQPASAPGFVATDDTSPAFAASSQLTTDSAGHAAIDIGGTVVADWVVGIVSLIFVALFGLALATARALYLQGRGLLKLQGFLCFRACSVPLVLAVSAEVLLLLAGVLLFAVLESPLVLLSCAFLPLLLGLLLKVVTQWVANDYSLLQPASMRQSLSPEFRAAVKARAAEAEAAERGVPVGVVLREQRRAARAEAQAARAEAAAKRGGGLDLSVADGQAAAEAAAQNLGGKKGRPGALALGGAGALGAGDDDSDLGLSGGEEEDEEDAAAAAAAAAEEEAARNRSPEEAEAHRRKQAGALSLKQRYAKWLAKMSDPKAVGAWDAFVAGFLTHTDYATLASLLGLVVLLCLYGGLVLATVESVWLGHVLYALPLGLLLSGMALVKLFQRYRLSADVVVYLAGGALIHVGLFLGLFLGPLNGDASAPAAVYLALGGFGWPLVLLTVCAFAAWPDNQWFMPPVTRYGLAVALPLWLVAVLAVFGWVSYTAGAILLVLVVFAAYATYLARVWVRNGFFLPEPHPTYAGSLLVACACLSVVVGLLADVDIFFAISIAFGFLVLLLVAKALSALSALPPGARVMVSPFLFPAYALDPATSELIPFSAAAADAVAAWGLALLWGLVATMLADPLDAGVGIACTVVVLGAVAAATVAGDAALRLGRSSKFLDEDVLRLAGDRARATFFERRRALDAHCEEFLQRDEAEAEEEAVRRREEEKKAVAAIEAEKDGKDISDTLALQAGGSGAGLAGAGSARDGSAGAPVDAFEAALAAQEGESLTALQELKAEQKERDMSQGIFEALARAERAVDRRAEEEVAVRRAVATGQMTLAQQAERQRAAAKGLPAPAMTGAGAAGGASALDAKGGTPAAASRRDSGMAVVGWAQADDTLESADAAPPDAGPALRGLFDSVVVAPSAVRRGGWHRSLDFAGSLSDEMDAVATLNREYFEESRLFAHFSLLVLVAAEARLQAEAVLFRRFLREYAAELSAAGVEPPESVFSSASFASLDVALVATWLQTLTPEQRQRFRAQRERFAAEQRARLEAQRREDKEATARAEAHLQSLRPRELRMAKLRAQDFAQRRAARRRAGIVGDGAAAVAAPEAEADENDNETVHEIERGHKGCVPGDYGREWQFRDSEFPHSASSIGPASRAGDIIGWRSSLALNPGAGLFKDGTDPDDVFTGLLQDNWFLSAVSIVAASGGVDDGDVDALVANLFVTDQTTETGMYAVRFWKNAQWETVVVDDYFPVVYDVDADGTAGIDDEDNEDDEDEDEEEAAEGGGGRRAGGGASRVGPKLSEMDADTLAVVRRGRGVAFAHASEMSEIWVPILEKAYAKYHGSYAALETGFVQHALTDLTGADAEEVFLSENRTGAAKLRLWAQLKQWSANGFLMGAGTVSRSASDRQLLDSGLVFGAVYTVYQVVEADGHCLIKLRNPPGDHGEWQGDWSDNSPLWTGRLRHKLGVVDDSDDGTFWMSVDDFVFAFRSLYLCRWFDPQRWFPETVTGFWKGPTAAGLPSRHNPHCRLADNPQFSLVLDRPTDIAITLTQALPGVTTRTTPHPVGVFVVAQTGSSQSEIHDRQRRKRIEREQQARGAVRLVMAAAGAAEDKGRRRADEEEDEEAYRERLQREAIAEAGGTEAGQLYNEVEAELRAEYAREGRSGVPEPREIRRRIRKKEKELKRLRRDAEDRARIAKEEAEEAAWEEEQALQVTAGLGGDGAGAGGAAPKRAERTYTLTAANVVASSGRPQRRREVRCYARLPPGAYTVLVAAYQRGMEGPFTLSLRSNCPVELQGLWPPTRDESVTHEYASGSPVTRLVRWVSGAVALAKRAMVGVDPVELAARQEEEAAAEAALSAMEEAAAEAEVERAATAVEASTVWVEQTDPVTGRSYWYNGETGESCFEVPLEVRMARGEVHDTAEKARTLKQIGSGTSKAPGGLGGIFADGLTMQRARARAAQRAGQADDEAADTPAAADAKTADTPAAADAKAADTPAAADAKTADTPAPADAKAADTPAAADAKTADTPAPADAKAADTPAAADAKTADTPAAADAKTADTPAAADAKTADTPAAADAKTADTPAAADAKTADTPAAADAKTADTPAAADAKTADTPAAADAKTADTPAAADAKTADTPAAADAPA